MQVYHDPDDKPEKPPIFRKGFPTIILILTLMFVVAFARRLLLTRAASAAKTG